MGVGMVLTLILLLVDKNPENDDGYFSVSKFEIDN